MTRLEHLSETSFYSIQMSVADRYFFVTVSARYGSWFDHEIKWSIYQNGIKIIDKSVPILASEYANIKSAICAADHSRLTALVMDILEVNRDR